MHRFFFIIFLSSALFISDAFCQAKSIEQSSPLDVGRDLDYQLIAAYNDTLLLYRQTRSRFLVQAYDDSLGLAWDRELIFENHSSKPFSLLALKEHFYIIYYFFKKGKTHIRAKKLDSKARELEDLELAIFENRSTLSSYQAISSEDKQTLLIYIASFEGNLEAVNFDLKTGTQRWQRLFNLEDIDYYKDFSQIILNNSGETFLLFDKNNIRRLKKEHQFVLYKISTDVQVTQFPIPFKSHLSYDVYFAYDELNKLLIGTGLYSKEPNTASGLFYFKTDFTVTPEIKLAPFDENFMRSLTGDKRKNMDGVSNFDIQKLVLRRDGGVILIAEQKLKYDYQTVNLFYQDEYENEQADYLFENILIASIHPSGEVHWKDVLFKSQDSENDNGRYSSFFMLKTKSNLRLLYNDEIRWDTNIYEYVINGVGDVERKIVQHSKGDQLLLEFRKGLQIASNVFVGTTERNNKLQVVRISY